MSWGVLDSTGDGVEGSQFEGLVCLVEGLAGLACGVGLADVVQSEGLSVIRDTLALLVFIQVGLVKI